MDQVSIGQKVAATKSALGRDRGAGRTVEDYKALGWSRQEGIAELERSGDRV